MGAPDPRHLLAEAERAGLTLTPDGDRLVIEPKSRLTDELRARLRAVKPELLALLQADATRSDRRTPSETHARWRVHLPAGETEVTCAPPACRAEVLRDYPGAIDAAPAATALAHRRPARAEAERLVDRARRELGWGDADVADFLDVSFREQPHWALVALTEVLDLMQRERQRARKAGHGA